MSLALAACAATAPPPHPNWSPAEAAAEQACRAGDLARCGEAGRSLLLADRNQRDVERALVLLEGACGGGDLPSCTTLGTWYLRQFETTSQVRSRELLTQACNGGAADACSILAPPPGPDILLNGDDLIRGPDVRPGKR